MVKPLEGPILPARWKVMRDPTNPDVVVSQPLSTKSLKEVICFLTLTDGVEKRGKGTEVHRIGTHEYQVRGNPVELNGNNPEVLCALGDFKLKQFFNRHRVCYICRNCCKIIHPVCVGQKSGIGYFLCNFLNSPVKESYLRCDFVNNFRVNINDKFDNTMG